MNNVFTFTTSDKTIAGWVTGFIKQFFEKHSITKELWIFAVTKSNLFRVKFINKCIDAYKHLSLQQSFKWYVLDVI